MKSSRVWRAAAAAAAVALLMTGCGGGKAGGNYPSKPMTVTAPAEPGSGWDTTARALVKVIEEQKQVKVPMPVQNRPGGTGCSYLTEMVGSSKGKDDQLAITSLASQTMKARGMCQYSPEDATVIATLFVENFMIVAPKDSPYRDLASLITALKTKPADVPVAAAGDDLLPFALLAKAAGVDPGKVKFVNYDGGGEQMTAMLNGDAKVAIAGISEFRASLDSGDLRGLVTFADKALPEPFASVPTAKSLGYDVVLGNWRGVYGPKDMPENAVKYWQDALTKLNDSQEWKDTLKKNQWEPEFNTGDKLDAYLKNASKTVADGVKVSGIGS